MLKPKGTVAKVLRYVHYPSYIVMGHQFKSAPIQISYQNRLYFFFKIARQPVGGVMKGR